MYLCDRDMIAAIQAGKLILDPETEVGPTSIDLHLDSADEAKIWDIDSLVKHNREHGLSDKELRISRINYGRIGQMYLTPPPTTDNSRVWRRGHQIILKTGGFLLWQTRERVGTPKEDPEFILFIDGKSTRARTGLVVHLTAPTIHAGWAGHITLEITNLGPFDIVLEAGDVIAQIVVARLTQAPARTMEAAGSVTMGQINVAGLPT